MVIYACGGSTPSEPTPAPTPVATPNFPVILAAGDISCDSATPQLPCRARGTSDLMMSARALHPAVVVLPLGDLQYEDGTLAEFRQSYNATWGRLNEFSHPVTGNHEYQTRNATGYFDYFAAQGVVVGARTEGWYSYNVGEWHFMALNSNCGSIGGCGANSAQARWLAADLAANQKKCAVAYMHHPFLSSGANGDTPALQPLMRLLYAANAEIVLAGHEHNYQRFEPMTPDAVADPQKGFRLFVVGTGGRDLTSFARAAPALSVIRTNEHFGVMEITMKDAAYSWAFINSAGITVDSGSGVCF